MVVIASLALAWPYLSDEITRRSPDRSQTLDNQGLDQSATTLQDQQPDAAEIQGEELNQEGGTESPSDAMAAGTDPADPGVLDNTLDNLPERLTPAPSQQVAVIRLVQQAAHFLTESVELP